MAALKRRLSRLVTRAQRKPGIPQREELSHGLRIDVLVKGETVHLQLSRVKVPPAEQEFKTVMRHWPWPMPDDMAHGVKEKDGRHYFTCAFPFQLVLLAEPSHSIKVEPQELDISITVYDPNGHWVEGDWASNPREARHKAEQLAKKYGVDTNTIPELSTEEEA